MAGQNNTYNDRVLYTRRHFIKICSLFGLQVFLGCTSAGVQLIEGRPGHHTTEGFRNFPVIPPPVRLRFKFFWNRMTTSFEPSDYPDDHSLSEEKAITQYNRLKDKNTLTWLGQSTFLLKIDGRTILTDPFFDEYVDPFSMIKRFTPVGISINNLPSLDAIILSHNHRDHLDEEAIEHLPGKRNIHVFAPLKLKSFFRDKGYRHIQELDWNQSATFGNFIFTANPAVHYSARGLTDRNKSLWCSWSISSPSGKYYFAGDTAFSSTIFKNIGARFGPFDLAMIPIGTYGNRKYGINNHVNPEEAIRVGMDIKTDIFVPMHWGTINLSPEPPREPPERLIKASREIGIDPGKVWIMKIGETRLL